MAPYGNWTLCGRSSGGRCAIIYACRVSDSLFNFRLLPRWVSGHFTGLRWPAWSGSSGHTDEQTRDYRSCCLDKKTRIAKLAALLGLGISLTGFLGKFWRSCNIGWHAGISRAGMPAYVAGASELAKETCKRNAEAYALLTVRPSARGYFRQDDHQ